MAIWFFTCEFNVILYSFTQFIITMRLYQMMRIRQRWLLLSRQIQWFSLSFVMDVLLLKNVLSQSRTLSLKKIDFFFVNWIKSCIKSTICLLLQSEAQSIYLRHLFGKYFRDWLLIKHWQKYRTTKLSNLRHFHFLPTIPVISQKHPPLPFNSAQKFLPSPLLLHHPCAPPADNVPCSCQWKIPSEKSPYDYPLTHLGEAAVFSQFSPEPLLALAGQRYLQSGPNLLLPCPAPPSPSPRPWWQKS